MFTLLTTLATCLRRIAFITFLLALLALLVDFVIANPQEVPLALLGLPVFTLKVPIIVVATFVVGGMVGLIVAWSSIAQLRLRNASLTRKLARRDKALQALRRRSLEGLKDA